MTTADRIQQRRLELNMTQEELANKLGLKDRSSVTKLEKSGNYISFKRLETVADALRCTVSYLLGMTSSPNDEVVASTVKPNGSIISQRKEIIGTKPETTDLIVTTKNNSIVVEKVGSPHQSNILPKVTGVTLVKHHTKMSSREELIKSLYDLDEDQIKDVANFVKFVKFKKDSSTQ